MLRWLGLALLGILVAAAVSIAASRLASQQIGLASQPISAGDALAPAVRQRPAGRHPGRHPGTPRTARKPTSPPPTTRATEPAPPPEPSPAPPAQSQIGGARDGETGGPDD
jgi:hypothetical protein